MSSAWDKANEVAESAGGGGLFVRLQNDKDKVVGAFCGDPQERKVIWTGSRFENFNPEIHEGEPKSRWLINFYVPDEGMKIIEGGSQWFKNVYAVHKKYGSEKWLFEVQRQGAKGDPKTKYSILPEEKIDDKIKASIESERLHDLTEYCRPETGDSKGDSKEDIPF